MDSENINEFKYQKMKTFTLLLFFLLPYLSVTGQSMKKQTLSQHGSSEYVYANNKSYFIQQSIGQASVINTFHSNNHELRQGFLQPVKAALINNGFDTEIDMSVYPNPFGNTVRVDFEETLIDVITISLHHISGQLIYQEIFEPAESLTLQFNNLPDGAYLLSGQMRAQSFTAKLIKH